MDIFFTLYVPFCSKIHRTAFGGPAGTAHHAPSAFMRQKANGATSKNSSYVTGHAIGNLYSSINRRAAHGVEQPLHDAVLHAYTANADRRSYLIMNAQGVVHRLR